MKTRILVTVVFALGLGSLTHGCGAATPAAPVAYSGDEGTPASPADAPQLTAKVVGTRALAGPEGLKIELVDLDDGTTLVRQSGERTEVTNLVLRTTPEDHGGGRLSFVTTVHGRDWNIVWRNPQSYGGGGYRWEAYLPGGNVRDGVRLEYSEELSAAVDAEQLRAQHLSQLQAGTLAELARFDRAGEQGEEEDAFSQRAERVTKACGQPLTATVAWDTVSDERLRDKSISGYCASGLSALEHACDDDAGKAFVAAQVQRYACRFDGDGTMKVEDGTLTWGIHFDLSNLDQRARETLRALPTASGKTLAVVSAETRTVVCADSERKRVVLIGPDINLDVNAESVLAYGDGRQFFRMLRTRAGRDMFFDPRNFNPQYNPNFDGLDIRYFSKIEPSKDGATCQLVCGTRKTTLQRVVGEEKSQILAAATYEDSPHGRRPYALARDARGRYYYVDQGESEAMRKDFRLYRGPRGNMKQLAMRDIVSDSEGEIFSSDSGDLRLVVDRDEAHWITRAGKSALKRLPIRENYGLIYNELGVYLGQRLGTPCDDF